MANRSTVPIDCGACGQAASEQVAILPFYLPDRDIETPIWRCAECGTYSRDIDLDDPVLKRHFDVASYTDPTTEERFRSVRSGYFVYLSQILKSRLNTALKGLRVLDVGTAYGHFLDQLKSEGASVEGVEIVAALRKRAAERGLIVHESIPSETSGRFDIITVIDSLYYANDPLASLKSLSGLLAPGGLLLIRIANRTWLLDFSRAVGLAIHRDRFGDAKYNFSPEGILLLLSRAGFRVDEVIWKEKGKADPRWLIRQFYRITPLLSMYLSLRVAPGMLLIAKFPK